MSWLPWPVRNPRRDKVSVAGAQERVTPLPSRMPCAFGVPGRKASAPDASRSATECSRPGREGSAPDTSRSATECSRRTHPFGMLRLVSRVLARDLLGRYGRLSGRSTRPCSWSNHQEDPIAGGRCARARCSGRRISDLERSVRQRGNRSGEREDHDCGRSAHEDNRRFWPGSGEPLRHTCRGSPPTGGHRTPYRRSSPLGGVGRVSN